MEQDSKKDYSLLRPFDLEAAKRGEAIIDTDGDECNYIAGPHKETAEIVVEFPCDLGFMTCMAQNLRMAPLAWVEGKPVYKGDVLYYKDRSKYAYGINIAGKNHRDPKDGGLQGNVCWVPDHGVWELGDEMWAPSSCYTWTPPKVKREGWVNVYSQAIAFTLIYATKEEADVGSGDCRIACVRIEWEEPAAQEGGAE